MERQPILCIGSALWDIIACAGSPIAEGNDLPGRIAWQPGGVALNVAMALVRAGQRSAILSTIGTDDPGDRLVEIILGAGVDCAWLHRGPAPTDSYLAIEQPDGAVFAAVADCAALEAAGDAILAPLRDGRLAGPATPWTGTVVIDGNLPGAVLTALAGHDMFRAAHLAFVPASPGKAERLKRALMAEGGTIYVNRTEAEILCQMAFPTATEAADGLLGLGATRAVVTDGPRPCALAGPEGLISAIPPTVETRSTTGAGDAFMAGHIAAENAGLFGQLALDAALEVAATHISREPV